ncbi:hypothetical protein [Streptomyces noursei]
MDAAAIRSGRKQVYVIEIIDHIGRVLADVPNRDAFAGYEGIYDRPAQILEAWLEYWAADHWTPCFGVRSGDLIRQDGEIWSVVDCEQIDQDYGDIGANTGFLICQSTARSVRRMVWIEQAVKVREITA